VCTAAKSSGPAVWPAILDEDVYYRLVAMLRTRSVRPSEGQRSSGGSPVHCAATRATRGCARTTTARRAARRVGGAARRVGAGRVTIAAEPVEQYIERAIRARFREPDAATLLEAPTDDRAVASARDRVKALQAQLDAHYAEATALRLSAAGLAAVEAGILPQIARARAEAQRLSVPAPLRELAGTDVATECRTCRSVSVATVAVCVADLRVTPAVRKSPDVDLDRLGQSRWRGDTRTWAEL